MPVGALTGGRWYVGVPETEEMPLPPRRQDEGGTLCSQKTRNGYILKMYDYPRVPGVRNDFTGDNGSILLNYILT